MTEPNVTAEGLTAAMGCLLAEADNVYLHDQVGAAQLVLRPVFAAIAEARRKVEIRAHEQVARTAQKTIEDLQHTVRAAHTRIRELEDQ